MEPLDQDLLHRYRNRLSEALEPHNLCDYLSKHGVLTAEEIRVIGEANDALSREARVDLLLDVLRKCTDGLHWFIRGLLLDKDHDFIAREFLEDSMFGERDVNALLQELREDLDEVQVLKLQLLQERKKHDNTKRELEEVKSSRNSVVFSEYDSSSGCSGFESSDTDAVAYLLRELEEERKRRQEAELARQCHRNEIEQLTFKTRLLEQSNTDLLRAVRSLEDLSTLQDDQEYRLPWKTSSLADICHSDDERCSGGMTRWRSEGDSGLVTGNQFDAVISPISDKSCGFMDLVQRVSSLEQELQDERTRREDTEFEMMKLGFENEELNLELELTREQLIGNHGELLERKTYDQDIDMRDTEVCDGSFGVTARMPHVHSARDNDLSSATTCHELRPRMHPELRHSITKSWLNINEEHYEMDEYEREIDRAENVPLDFRDTLRSLKSKTWTLLNEIMDEGKELRHLRVKAGKMRPRKVYHKAMEEITNSFPTAF
ncbi:uncharacterized protein LOC116604610 isoform X2 [Nematostella vectensis]|nr:uncharacterized protein LOC116604610 isoform X2 [Nematostella vectensis]